MAKAFICSVSHHVRILLDLPLCSLEQQLQNYRMVPARKGTGVADMILSDLLRRRNEDAQLLALSRW
jgi:hypothetical protein